MWYYHDVDIRLIDSNNVENMEEDESDEQDGENGSDSDIQIDKLECYVVEEKLYRLE